LADLNVLAHIFILIMYKRHGKITHLGGRNP